MISGSRVVAVHASVAPAATLPDPPGSLAPVPLAARGVDPQSAPADARVESVRVCRRSACAWWPASWGADARSARFLHHRRVIDGLIRRRRRAEGERFPFFSLLEQLIALLFEHGALAHLDPAEDPQPFPAANQDQDQDGGEAGAAQFSGEVHQFHQAPSGTEINLIPQKVATYRGSGRCAPAWASAATTGICAASAVTVCSSAASRSRIGMRSTAGAGGGSDGRFGGRVALTWR